MYLSIQGILQFQIFQIPMVGADTCGFSAFFFLFSFAWCLLGISYVDGNTDEELCNRWMQLAAFTPFYRNHNVRGAISQEPYRWDSVASASKTAISARYSLLPYWVSVQGSLVDTLPELIPPSLLSLPVYSLRQFL